MIIVYSANAGQNAEIERLFDAYDGAQTDGEREGLAERIFEQAGPEIGRKLQNVANGGLTPDQIHALSRQALTRGLNESGMSFLSRRQSGTWSR